MILLDKAKSKSTIHQSTNPQVSLQLYQSHTSTMPPFYDDTISLFGDNMTNITPSEASSHYTEDSQPRICSNSYCTFPMGNICQACSLDLVLRRKWVSKSTRVWQAKQWVEDINSHGLDYTDDLFADGAHDCDTKLEGADKQNEDTSCLDYDDEATGHHHWSDGNGNHQSNEPDDHYVLGEEHRPDSTELVPQCFGSDGKAPSSRPSTAARSFPSRSVFSRSTSISSKLSVDSVLSDNLDLWATHLVDQGRDATFVGRAEDNSSQEICPFCGGPPGDPTYQHLLRCQYAHEEQERSRAFLERRFGSDS